MKRVAFVLALVGCGGPRPWEAPWAAQPVRPVEAGPYAVDLPTVLRLAGANNLDVAIVRESAHEAYGAERIAEEKFWPTAGLSALFRRHEGLTQGTDGKFVDVDKQQLFAGGRMQARWEPGDAIFSKLAASQRFEGSLHRLEAAEQSVSLEAAVAYFDLLREVLRGRISEQSVQISEKLVAQLESAVSLGRSFKGDLLRSRVQLAGHRLNVLRAKESMGVASIRLASILRLAQEIQLVPVEDRAAPLALVPPETTVEVALRDAFDKRPEIQEALAELAASRHEQTSATWGAAIPDVYVDVAPGGLGPTPGKMRDTLDYSVMMGWRIGPGGLFDPGRQHLADARAAKAEINLERARQRVTEQVSIAWTQWKSRLEQMQIAEQAIKDAEEALDLNVKRQATGVGIPLEVIQAEEALTRARLDYLTSVIDFNQAQLRLFAYRGSRLR